MHQYVKPLYSRLPLVLLGFDYDALCCIRTSLCLFPVVYVDINNSNAPV